MKRRLQDIVRDVEQKLPANKYGFKRTLSTNVDKTNFTFTIDSLDKSEEYDCLYYNLKGKDFLEKKGIKTTLVKGQDESGLWRSHSYLRTVEGEIIDFTPIYPTLGAKHRDEEQLGNTDIEECMRAHELSINNMLPLHFDQESISLLRIGVGLAGNIGLVKSRKPHIEIYMDLLQYDPISKKYMRKEELILYHTGKEIKPDMTSLKSLIDNNVLEIDGRKTASGEIIKMESDIDNYVMAFLRKIL